MRSLRLVAISVAVAMVLGACSSSDEPTLGDEVAPDQAATAEGVEQAPLIVQTGDATAEAGAVDDATEQGDAGEALSTTLAVGVQLPDGVAAVGQATVVVYDVSAADSPIEVVRAQVPSENLVNAQSVDLFVPLPMDGSTPLAASVLIDTDGNGALSPGDLASAGSVPLVPGSNSITIPVAAQ